MTTRHTQGSNRWVAPGAAAVLAFAVVLLPQPARAGTVPPDAVRRVLTMLEAAAEDYREGVRDGSVVRAVEVEEATAFLEESQQRVESLTLDPNTASALHTLFSSARAAVDRQAPPAQVADMLTMLRERLATATGVSALAYPPAPPAAARGQRLFAENCVSCHGERGDGKGPSAAQLTPPPADFTDASFIRGETPYDFFHVISLGKRNTAMPAWDGALSVQDRWDLVAYLWTLAPGTATLAEGQGVYLTQCASCHGATANGHAPFAEVLITPAHDLTQPQELAQRTDTELFAATTNGLSGSPMPAFAHTLSAADRWKTVAFLRALSLGGSLPASGGAVRGPAPDGTRFAGLLRLLAREYAAAWSDDQLTNTLEYDEASALAEQVARVGDSVAAALAARAPDAAGLLRAQVAGLVSAIHERAPAAHVTAAVETLATLVQTHEVVPVETQATAAGTSSDVDAALAASTRLVETALTAYGRGDTAAAGTAADAYLEFEPIEQRLGATAPGLKTRVETLFMQFRQALRSPNNAVPATAAKDGIANAFADVRTALQPHSSPYALFLESATIIFREGFEMVLVIGALLAYVVKSGNLNMRKPIYGGTAGGVVASLATAAVMGELLRLHPSSSDLLEGCTMLLAAVVLFWVSYWLISKAEADKWQRYIRGKVQRALSGRRTVALAGAAFLAVYREGFETVLFYQALYTSAPGQSTIVTAGFIAGAIVLAAVYAAFRRFQVKIPIQQFFFVTGLLLYAMAAVFAGQGVHELQDAGVVSVTSVDWMPTLPLLGVFPTLESLGTQALFVALLLYATAVTLRRRTKMPALVSDGSVVAEVQALHVAVDAVRQELSALCATTAARGDTGSGDAIQEQVSGVLLQVERLAGELAKTPVARLANAGGRSRH